MAKSVHPEDPWAAPLSLLVGIMNNSESLFEFYQTTIDVLCRLCFIAEHVPDDGQAPYERTAWLH